MMGSYTHRKGIGPLGNCDRNGWSSSAHRPHFPGCWPGQPESRKPHSGEGSSSPPETWAHASLSPLDSAWSQQRAPAWSTGSLMGFMGPQTLSRPESHWDSAMTAMDGICLSVPRASIFGVGRLGTLSAFNCICCCFCTGLGSRSRPHCPSSQKLHLICVPDFAPVIVSTFSLHFLLILGSSVAEPLTPLNSLPAPHLLEGNQPSPS